MAQNDAVGCRAPRGQRAQHFAEDAHLVFLEVPLRVMGLGPLDSFLQFRGVHTHLGGRLALPGSGSGKIGGPLGLRSLRGKPGSHQNCNQGQ